MPSQHMMDPKFPVPEHISKVARDFLSQAIDLSRAFQPTPQSIEEWEAKIAREEAPFIPLAEQMVAAAPVTVTKREIAGVTVRDVVHQDESKRRKNGVVLYFHGGAYIKMGGDFSVVPALPLVVAGFHIISVDYRMPPRHPYPAALEDGLGVYKDLLESYNSDQVIVSGESAGGGLAAAVVLAARDCGLPQPAAVVMNTPWADLDKIGDSYFTNDGVDPSLPSYEILRDSAKMYAGGADLKDPMLSPVYGDYSPGFPPSLLVTGTRDIMLSCTVRLHRRLREAGVTADLHVMEAMWHSFMLVAPEEAAEIEREIIVFIERHLDRAR